MEKRIEELSKLKSYTDEIDKDITMILQSLQWDRKHILQHPVMATCRYDSNHRILKGKLDAHEQECLLKHNGYSREDLLLPEPFDINSNTVLKLSKEDITQIIDNAAKLDPTLRRVHINTKYGCIQLTVNGSLEPQSVERLQSTYSQDERRAIHDAVVSAVPSCHDLIDLALPSMEDDGQAPKVKTRTEILAELRDMRRRRTKYRVAAKTRNYSDVLRDVIKTQMEMFNEATATVDTKSNEEELESTKNQTRQRNDNTYETDSHREHRRDDILHRNKDGGRDENQSRYAENKERSNNRDSLRDRYKETNERDEYNTSETTKYRDGEKRYDDRRNRDYRHGKHDTTFESSNSYAEKSRSRHDDRRERHHFKNRRDSSDYRGDRSDKHRDRSDDRRDRAENLDRSGYYKDQSGDRKYGSNDRRYRADKRKDRSDDGRDNKDLADSGRNRSDDRRHRYDKHRDRSKDRNDRSDNLKDRTDGERAKNLMLEIKRELELGKQQDDIASTKGSTDRSIEIAHEKHKDYVARSSHQTDEGHEIKRETDSVLETKNCKDHKRKKKSRDEEKDSSSEGRKHKKSKREKHKKRRRDKSNSSERKISKTEDKHKIYYEIYTELDNRKPSENDE